MSIPCLTIDGPSGVGKGTAARHISQRFGWHMLDSGAMYRVAAIAATDAGIATTDAVNVANCVRDMEVRFDFDVAGAARIWLDGQEVTQRVRSESAGMAASEIAVHPAVRDALLSAQRAFLKAPGLVADGRDMGSIVFADAPLKCFLDASAEERARRRHEQLSKAGTDAILADVLADITARDARDRNRSVAPLVPAEDAVVIDTTHLDVAAVTQQIIANMQDRGLV